jgi:RNA polymerase sigma-70 factor (ECF subfamily)
MSLKDHEISELLTAVGEGQEGAMETLMDRVYEDLVRVADRHLKARHGPDLAGTTLEPAALANETFLKLIKQRNRYDSRGHFFAIATRVMLRVLNDYYRERHAAKRGGGLERVTLSGLVDEQANSPGVEIPEVLDALEQLEKLDARTAEVTKLRLIWGLTIPEVSSATGISIATVAREWEFARRWLSSKLG